MTTATTKTASPHTVFCFTRSGNDIIALRMHDADTLQDALEYRDIHGLADAEVWVTFTTGMRVRVA